MASELLSKALSFVVHLEVEPLEKAQERAQTYLRKDTQFEYVLRDRLGEQHVDRKIAVPPVIQKREVIVFELIHLPWFPLSSTLFKG